MKVVCGANETQGRAGLTVAGARQEFAELLNIEDEAIALVNDEEVEDDYILQEEDVLEFVKDAGDKG